MMEQSNMQSQSQQETETQETETKETVNQAFKLQEYMNQAGKIEQGESNRFPEANDIMAIFNEIESHENEKGLDPLTEQETAASLAVEVSDLEKLHQAIIDMKPKQPVSFEDVEIEDQRGINPADHQDTIQELCLSKAEEFSMLGYEHVTTDEIWQCVSSKYKKGTPALHQVVNDILSLKVTQFMNWMTMSSVYMRK